jgi:Ca-activated chloride channel family protein
MMELGMREALDLQPDAERSRFVCFLTDGFIGNEPDVLRAMGERLGSTRVFSVGIGSSPNRHLMESMARVGGGAAAFFYPGDGVEEVMDLFMERVSRPAMTHVAIDWAGMDVTDVHPRTLPDLYVGRPVLVTGRFKGTATGPITIRGKAGGEVVTMQVAAEEVGKDRKGVARVWARRAIMDMEDHAMRAQENVPAGAIKNLALSHGLMSAYTAFVAVDSLSMTEGSHGTTVAVPVPVPQGVRYETAVGR